MAMSRGYERKPGGSTLVQAKSNDGEGVRPPGKRTLTESIGTDAIHEAATSGISGPGGALPHLDVIQRSFGHHDVSGIEAHTSENAAAASRSMGAEAYATGSHVAFSSPHPTL